MRDSNWKKLGNIVRALLKTYKTTHKSLEEMSEAYQKLTAALDPIKVAQWELDAFKAGHERGETFAILVHSKACVQ
ncbi:hypothetical protein ID866_10937 [Astraeus odoratus]|nr:hypothetical protein ID866_10937 [Astraeus odoratus]